MTEHNSNLSIELYQPEPSQVVYLLVDTAGESSLLDQAIAGWLHLKGGLSGSKKTLRAYQDTINDFRQALDQAGGLDLDSEPTAVALAAQGFAARPGRNDRLPAAATYNLRLTILSSFYEYALKMQLIPGLAVNPLDRVSRRKVTAYADVQALDPVVIRERLGTIDRSTPTGMRDFALLHLTLATGRRVAEIAGLRLGDLAIKSVASGKAYEVFFRRCKGGKQMRDQLSPAVSAVLADYLKIAYPPGAALAASLPLWVAFSPGAQRSRALPVRTLQKICEKRLGVSRFHSLRHTFAHSMEESGAKISDIQARLGHESLETTGRYLKAMKRAENDQADALAALFGL